MKQTLFLLFLALSAVAGSGQTLFFHQLKNSTWTTEKIFNDSTIQKEKEIHLIKLTIPIEDLKTNKLVWTFNDNLSLSIYNAITKKDSLIGTYKYAPDEGKLLLKIIPDDKRVLSYKVSMVSSGFYVTLSRK